jgi:DNA (cytosine-5)-methyltransferase 1
MRFGSVCSGIEAASTAWHPLGWKAAFFSEIEAFPSALLAHRYPHVPNHGDMTRFHEWPDHAIDLLVGGTPCQSFSVAGLRKGLADPRGNLALTYLAIADRYRPEWLVWENVPGVLSSDGGRDFGAFLGGLGELGYGFAYRVLDAQFVRVDGFGRAVPQRRRRVFVVGHSGDWRRAAAVLFERESLSWHSAPRREAGERIAAYTPSSIGGYREGFGTLRAEGGDIGGGSENLIASTGEVSHCLNAGAMGRIDYETETMVVAKAVAFQPRFARNDRGAPSEIAYPLTAEAGRTGKGDSAQCVAFKSGQSEAAGGIFVTEGFSPTLQAQNNGSTAVPSIQTGWAVRRLTPTECERLQGFPDGWTDVPYRDKPAADGPRYKALGNSMACNVMRWIGRRIEAVSAILDARKDAA